MASDVSLSNQGWRIDTVQVFCNGPTPTATPTATAAATDSDGDSYSYRHNCADTDSTPTPNPNRNTNGNADARLWRHGFFVAAKDNTLYEDSAGQLSNGQGIYFFDGKTGANLLRRGLIAFDLASIPTNATITGATLSMFLSQAQGGSQAVSLSTALRDWGEGASDAGNPGGGGAPAQAGDATWLHTFTTPVFGPLPGATFHPRPAQPRQSAR